MGTTFSSIWWIKYRCSPAFPLKTAKWGRRDVHFEISTQGQKQEDRSGNWFRTGKTKFKWLWGRLKESLVYPMGPTEVSGTDSTRHLDVAGKSEPNRMKWLKVCLRRRQVAKSSTHHAEPSLILREDWQCTEKVKQRWLTQKQQAQLRVRVLN